jgi:hypothetical protein
MTKLSAEAYAIVEGRHSDPFHYLGLHTEGDKTRGARVPAGGVEGRRDRRAWRSGRCACRKSHSDIMVMQSTQDRTAKNVSGPFDGA